MRTALIVAISGLLAVLAAAPAPGSASAAPARACPGSITEEIAGTTWRVRSIRTTGMSCKAGKKQIRSFFHKADRNSRCRRASERPPPTKGCAVGRFHCWRGIAKYCARTGQDVSWRERRA
jgi:hypothetical protein